MINFACKSVFSPQTRTCVCIEAGPSVSLSRCAINVQTFLSYRRKYVGEIEVANTVTVADVKRHVCGKWIVSNPVKENATSVCLAARLWRNVSLHLPEFQQYCLQKPPRTKDTRWILNWNETRHVSGIISGARARERERSFDEEENEKSQSRALNVFDRRSLCYLSLQSNRKVWCESRNSEANLHRAAWTGFGTGGCRVDRSGNSAVDKSKNGTHFRAGDRGELTFPRSDQPLFVVDG